MIFFILSIKIRSFSNQDKILFKNNVFDNKKYISITMKIDE